MQMMLFMPQKNQQPESVQHSNITSTITFLKEYHRLNVIFKNESIVFQKYTV